MLGLYDKENKSWYGDEIGPFLFHSREIAEECAKVVKAEVKETNFTKFSNAGDVSPVDLKEAAKLRNNDNQNNEIR